MPLYLITRTDIIKYDEYDSFVVRAKTPEEALQTAMLLDTWGTKADNTTITQLKTTGQTEVIIASFNAG